MAADITSYDVTKAIAGSERDGWLLGYIGVPWPGPWPKRCGDLWVSDPGGWQAGLAWESTGAAIQEVAGPTEGRWGVFRVKFPIPVMSERDLVANFHVVLPLLKAKREKVGF